MEAPPDVVDKYRDYNLLDVAQELGQYWLADLRKSMNIPEEEPPIVSQRQNLRGLPKSYQPYEEKKKPSIVDRVASAIILTGAIPEHIASGLWNQIKEYKKELPEMMREPEKNATKWTNLLIDVGVKPSFVHTVQPNVLATLGGVKGAKALGKFKRTMFHGSPISGLKELKEGTGGEFQRVAGIYLTKSKDEALKYTKVAGKKNAQNIYEVEVNFKNPARRDVLDEIGYMKNGKIISGTEMRDELIKRGYDSVIDDSMNEIIAFKPEQVKIIKSSQSPLKQAILDIHRGANPEKVWKKYGWTKDPSGKWMFRIDDSGAKLRSFKWRDESTRPFKTIENKLPDILDHPELFKAYPELRDLDIRKTSKGGSYTGGTLYFDGTRSSLFHEIQHAIQEIEGFAPGSSPGMFESYKPVWDAVKNQWTHPKHKEAMKSYKSTAGEIYAREEAAGFKGMPGTMENIPVEDWIIKKGKGTSFKIIPK